MSERSSQERSVPTNTKSNRVNANITNEEITIEKKTSMEQNFVTKSKLESLQHILKCSDQLITENKSTDKKSVKNQSIEKQSIEKESIEKQINLKQSVEKQMFEGKMIEKKSCNEQQSSEKQNMKQESSETNITKQETKSNVYVEKNNNSTLKTDKQTVELSSIEKETSMKLTSEEKNTEQLSFLSSNTNILIKPTSENLDVKSSFVNSNIENSRVKKSSFRQSHINRSKIDETNSQNFDSERLNTNRSSFDIPDIIKQNDDTPANAQVSNGIVFTDISSSKKPIGEESRFKKPSQENARPKDPSSEKPYFKKPGQEVVNSEAPSSEKPYRYGETPTPPPGKKNPLVPAPSMGVNLLHLIHGDPSKQNLLHQKPQESNGFNYYKAQGSSPTPDRSSTFVSKAKDLTAVGTKLNGFDQNSKISTEKKPGPASPQIMSQSPQTPAFVVHVDRSNQQKVNY